MPSTVHLVLMALTLAVLAGCDPAAQTRYHPTSTDEAFGAFSQVSQVHGTVYELPALAPGEATGQRVCRPPGQRLKPVDMVGIRDDRMSYRTLEPTVLVAMYEPPIRSPLPGPTYPVASWNQHQEPGAKERIWTPPYAPKLEPGRSVHSNEPAIYAAYRRDEYSYCNDAANQR